jgi:hypothetical protein
MQWRMMNDEEIPKSRIKVVLNDDDDVLIAIEDHEGLDYHFKTMLLGVHNDLVVFFNGSL